MISASSPLVGQTIRQGGCRFGDFGRIGLPLHLLLAAAAVRLIPLRWPF